MKQTRIVFRSADGFAIAKYVGPKEACAADARKTADMILAEASVDPRGFDIVSGVAYYKQGKALHATDGVALAFIDGVRHVVPAYGQTYRAA
jgi:hypothetical protein